MTPLPILSDKDGRRGHLCSYRRVDTITRSLLSYNRRKDV